MKSIEESVVTAMDGTDKELFHFLPYILQDLWEIGTDPNVISSLIFKHCNNYSKLKILDLGCGKGAVSINIAQKFNCRCLGVDAVREFIDDAKTKAIEYQVNHLCKFVIGDIRKRLEKLSKFDVIILGAIGPVFGDYYSTLNILSKSLVLNGIFIIDDSYIEKNSEYKNSLIQSQEVIYRQIKASGMELIDEFIFKKKDIKASDGFIFDNIKKRCFELIAKYPDRRKLFDNYIKKQKEENDVLENKVICSTMVIKKIKPINKIFANVNKLNQIK